MKPGRLWPWASLSAWLALLGLLGACASLEPALVRRRAELLLRPPPGVPLLHHHWSVNWWPGHHPQISRRQRPPSERPFKLKR